jgi:hypothetical protein
MDENTVARLLPAIPADVTHTPDGSPLDEESIQGVRRSRASQWAEAGFRDPVDVHAWMAAGVVSPKIAGIARKRGYRPGDPWVPAGHVHVYDWDNHPGEPVARRSTARTNRRNARRDWLADLERAAIGDRQLAELAALLRANVTAGSGQHGLFGALGIAAATEAGPDPELVAGVVDAVDIHTSASYDLAVATRDHLEVHTLEETASWFADQLRTSVIPCGDTIPFEHWSGTAGSWLAREAESMCEYVHYMGTMTRAVRGCLDRLEQAEEANASVALDRAQAALDAADLAWSGLATARG